MLLDDFAHLVEILLGLLGIGIFLYWYIQKPIKKRKSLATAMAFFLGAGVLYNVLRCFGIPSESWMIHAVGSGLDIAGLLLICIGGVLMIWAKS